MRHTKTQKEMQLTDAHRQLLIARHELAACAVLLADVGLSEAKLVFDARSTLNTVERVILDELDTATSYLDTTLTEQAEIVAAAQRREQEKLYVPGRQPR